MLLFSHARSLSNLMRGQPQPEWEAVRPALSTLKLMIESANEEVAIGAAWSAQRGTRMGGGPPTVCGRLTESRSSHRSSLFPLLCRALSYLSNESGAPSVIQSGVVPRLVDLLDSPNPQVVAPCLRVLGNLLCLPTPRASRSAQQCSSPRVYPSHPFVLFCHCVVLVGSDAGKQAVLSAGFLSKLDRLLCHPTASLRKESAWALSSVLAGTPAHIQSVLDANLLPALIQRMLEEETGSDVMEVCAMYEQTARAVARFCAGGVCPAYLIHAAAECRRCARCCGVPLFVLCRCVINPTDGGTPEQIRFVASSLGGVPALCTLLAVSDANVVMVALEGLHKFLQAGQQVAADAQNTGHAAPGNTYVEEIDRCGGWTKLKMMQHHANRMVRQSAIDILGAFFQMGELE